MHARSTVSRPSRAPLAFATLLLAAVPLPAAGPAEPPVTPVRSIDATLTAMYGDWPELARLDLDRLDPATAELAIHRGVEPRGGANAAVHYLRMLLLMPEWSEEADTTLGLSFPDRLAALRDGAHAEPLDRLDAVIQPLRAAVSSGTCDWSVAVEAGIQALLPELGELRGLARWHLLSADRELADDRPLEALRRYRETLALARDAMDGSTLIGLLVGVAVESLALERIVEATPALIERGVEPDRLARVVRRRHRDAPDLHGALAGERAWLLDTMRNASALVDLDGSHASPYESLAAFLVSSEVFGLDDDVPDAAELRRRAVDSGRVDPARADDPRMVLAWVLEDLLFMQARLDELLLAADLDDERGSDAVASFADSIRSSTDEHPLTALFLPAMDRVVASLHDFETTRRAVDVLLASAAVRDRTGAWPASLDDLLAVDPWLPVEVSGRDAALRYVVDPDADMVRVAWTDRRDEDHGYAIAWPAD